MRFGCRTLLSYHAINCLILKFNLLLGMVDKTLDNLWLGRWNSCISWNYSTPKNLKDLIKWINSENKFFGFSRKTKIETKNEISSKTSKHQMLCTLQNPIKFLKFSFLLGFLSMLRGLFYFSKYHCLTDRTWVWVWDTCSTPLPNLDSWIV